MTAETSRRRRREQCAPTQDQEAKSRVERRIPEVVLEEEDEVEQHAEQGAIHGEGGDQPTIERWRPKEGEVEHRVGDVRLDEPERHEQHAAENEERDDLGV